MAPAHAHAHAHAHDPAGQLPQGAQQLSVRQVVHQDYWDNHPGFQERLRAHMRAELARTATQQGVQLLHQPVEEVAPVEGYPTHGWCSSCCTSRVAVVVFAWAAPYSLRLEWQCEAPPHRRCTPGSTLHAPFCGWRLAPVLK